MQKASSLGLSSWLYWNQLLIPIVILPVNTSVKEMINYWLQLLHFTAELYVKLHPHFRLMVWYINAESYLWVSSREMLQNPKWGGSLCTASFKEGSHRLCSDICIYKSWWLWFCLWTKKQMTPSWGQRQMFEPTPFWGLLLFVSSSTDIHGLQRETFLPHFTSGVGSILQILI